MGALREIHARKFMQQILLAIAHCHSSGSGSDKFHIHISCISLYLQCESTVSYELYMS